MFTTRTTRFGLALSIAVALGASGVAVADAGGASPTVVAASAAPAAVVSEPTTSTAPATTSPTATLDPTSERPAAPEPLPAAPPSPEAALEPVQPEPAPPPSPAEAAPATAEERVAAALVEAVPAAWRDDLAVTVVLIEGSTSWATPSGEIQIGRVHAEGRWSHLVSVLGHEFGHIIAWAYGSHAYNGAAPEGWPDPQHGPSAEAWADCVSEVFTGIVDPSYGMPPCPAHTRDWTAAWLGAGPP